LGLEAARLWRCELSGFRPIINLAGRKPLIFQASRYLDHETTFH
jgi:hypothetical protein